MISRLHPRLQPYFQAVLDHEYGLQRNRARIEDVSSGKAFDGQETAEDDQVVLLLPFASQLLRWQVIFNSEQIENAPDLIDEAGFFETLPVSAIKKTVPSLWDWNPANRDGLLNIILQLLELYQRKQIEMMTNNENLQRYFLEYEMLSSSLFIEPFERMQVSVLHTMRGTTVEFCVAIDVDISQTNLPEPDSHRPIAVLVVTYRTQNETSVELQVWNKLEELIGTTEVPPIDANVTLLDYVPDVQAHLQLKIDRMLKKQDCRKNVFGAMTDIVDSAVLEADNVNNSKLSFLLEFKGCQIICTIFLSEDFPDESPAITLSKIDSSGVQQEKMDRFSLQPHWNHATIATNILKYVKKEAHRFNVVSHVSNV